MPVELLATIALVLGTFAMLYATYRIVMWIVRNQFSCRSCGGYLQSYEVTLCSTCDKAERLAEFRYEQHTADRSGDEICRDSSCLAGGAFRPEHSHPRIQNG